MNKITFLLAFLAIILCNHLAFSQTTLEWETGATNNGSAITSTELAGVNITVSTNNGDTVTHWDGGGNSGATGNIIYNDGFGGTELKISFDVPVDVISIYHLGRSGTTETLTFTPTGGVGNSVKTDTHLSNAGATVALNWTGITSFTITGSVYDLYAIDEMIAKITVVNSVPTVATTAASAIATTSATLGGNVTANGGATVTERGIVWNTSANPTISNNKASNGTGAGVFSGTVSGLPASSKIYYRAYAINSVGTSYGVVETFTTNAATILSEGDIAFTRINIDDETFSFVFLIPIENGTQFVITDETWSSSNIQGNFESKIRFIATSSFVAGEEISITTRTMSFASSGSGTATITSIGVINPVAGNMLGALGDNLFIFQPEGTPGVNDFIAGINANSGNTGTPGNAWQVVSSTSISSSGLPSGLTNGTNALGLFPFGAVQSEVDNIRYKSSVSYPSAIRSGDKATVLAAIMDLDNWEYDNSTPWPALGTSFVINAVADTTKPIITVCASTPSNISAGTSCQGTVPDLIGSVTATDNSGVNPVITQSPAAGATLGLGTTTITLTATDGAGNTATCTVDQKVVDNTNPVIICPGNQTEIPDAIGDFVLPDYTGAGMATDNCTGAPTVTQSPVPGTVISETTTVTLTVTDGANNSSQCTFDVEIYDAPTVSLSLSGSPLAENAGVATITATLSAVSSRNVTVTIAPSGTATGSGVDYTLSSTTITINAGSPSGTATITGADDALDESVETVIIDITGVANAIESGTQQVTASIFDDDDAPTVTLSLSGSPLAENGGVATVRATLNTASSQIVTVTLGVTGTATGGGTDYNLSNTTITILAGATFGTATVTGVDDAIDEPAETVVVDITGVANGTESGTQQVTASITNNDVTAPVFENSTPSSSNITTTGFTLNTDIDEAGTIYYMVLDDMMPAPSSGQVKVGTGIPFMATAVTSGNTVANSGGFTHNFSVTGLTAGSSYDVYVVAQDNEGAPNLQVNPTKIDITTGSLIPLIVTGLTGNNKEYDGTTVASASGTPVLSAALLSSFGFETDAVNLSGSPVYTFATSNIGAGISITTTGFTLSGADSGKYTLIQPTLSANIAAINVNLPHTLIFSTVDGTNLGQITSDGQGGSSDIVGRQFNFEITDDSGNVSNEDVIYKLGTVVNGLSTSNYEIDGMSIKTDDGSEFDFNGFTANNFFGTTADELTITGFRDGLSTGSMTFGIVGMLIVPDLSNATFGNVDEVRITLPKNGYLGGFNDFRFGEAVKLATVTATAATTITSSGSTLIGDVTANGGATITERGFVYSKTSDDATPTFTEVNATTVIKVVVAGITGSFNQTITGLTANSGYSYIAYATNSVGTKESSVHTFTTINTAPTITSTAVISVNEGETYTYNVTANDADGDDVTVTASTIPSWLSITTAETVSTLAGSSQGFADGTGAAAKFNSPFGVAVDASGNIYVADNQNHKIRKITQQGEVTTLAGSGVAGFADGIGATAQFDSPRGIAVDTDGNVYVADAYNNRIRKITPSGVVSTLAGSVRGFYDGTGDVAQFNTPSGVAVDATGNVYVADSSNSKIRKITPSGVVSTFAGSTSGFADATGTAAKFKQPMGIAIGSSGSIYVADTFNDKVRKITTAGVVTSIAGGAWGFSDGIGAAASFKAPRSIALDNTENIYIADTFNHKLRKISATGEVTTIATDTADFSFLKGVGIDAAGTIYITDDYSKIQKITRGTTLIGSPTNTEVGSHNVALKVSDGKGGTTTQSFTITVNDVTAPLFEDSTPSSASIASTSFTLNTDIDEAGTIYYVVVADGATAPTSAEVKAGTGNSGSGQVTSANVAISTGSFTNAFSVTGLTSETAYDVYVVVEDDEGTPNLQASPTKIDITTINSTPTITFNNISKTYGDANFDLAVTSNSIGTISYSVVTGGTGAATLSGTNNKTVIIGHAGTVTIRAAQTAGGIYDSATKDITLTINKATLTATADVKSREYGEVNPVLTFTYGAFKNGETSAVLDTEPTASTTAIITTDAGTESITVSGGSDTNYSFSYTSANLTINKATLTATADDKSRKYGEVNPAFTITFIGFKNGEDKSVIDTEPMASTTASATTNAGAADISLIGGSDTNYSITLENGVLTIVEIAPSIETANPTNVTGVTTVLGGEITSIGGGNILDRGIVYSSSNGTPTTADIKVEIGNGSGTFSEEVSGLNSETTYYYQAYVTNSTGTSYGGVMTFTTLDITAPNAPVIVSISDTTCSETDDITADNTLIILGTAEANASLEIFMNAISVGTTITDASGNWTFDHSSTILPDDYYVFTATATDAASNTSDMSTDFEIEISTIDTDNDGAEDFCDEDDDNDGIDDDEDNSPLIPNSDQSDIDGNGIADVDEDCDNDGIVNYYDTDNSGCQEAIAQKKKYGFSPNGDGVNDTWFIKGIELYPNNVVRVYNRSGKLVFEKKGYKNTWNGDSNKVSGNDKLPVGGYLFILELNSQKVKSVKGWLYINY